MVTIKDCIDALQDNIKDFYFHRNATNGALEINIEFKDYLITQEFLDSNRDNIKEIKSCAVWE